jgi:NADPH2:quinone reductase
VETGQRVIGSPSNGLGAFAEYALMDASNACPVPDSVTDEKAAALYLADQTGYDGPRRRATSRPATGCSCTQAPGD